MRVIVTGIKGGVGKSSIAYSILKEAREEGNKVLFIDMDNTLTISNILGVNKPTRLDSMIVVPFDYNLKEMPKLEDYRREVNVEIADAPYKTLSYYPKLLENLREKDIVILVTNEIPYVLSNTIEYAKLLKSQYKVNNVILTVNMMKGEIKYVNEFPVIRIPFSYTLLYKGVSAAPSFIKIWKDIKSFVL